MYEHSAFFVEEMRNIVGFDNVYISTAPSLLFGCAGAKISWLYKKLQIPINKIMIGSAKELMANHETLLIDDRDSNVNKFVLAGGRAVLFPRVWNSRYAEALAYSPLNIVLNVISEVKCYI